MSSIHAPTLAIRLEGGLLSPDILESALAGDLPGQQPRDFGLDGARSLTDEIAGAFADAQAQWALFRRRLARTPPNPPAGGGLGADRTGVSHACCFLRLRPAGAHACRPGRCGAPGWRRVGRTANTRSTNVVHRSGPTPR